MIPYHYPIISGFMQKPEISAGSASKILFCKLPVFIAGSGKYVCTFSEKTGVPDMACVNWPGTYQCVDAAIMSGGSSKEFFLIKGANRQYYKESLLKCKNHRMPDMPDSRRYHAMTYVNDYLGKQSGFLPTSGFYRLPVFVHFRFLEVAPKPEVEQTKNPKLSCEIVP